MSRRILISCTMLLALTPCLLATSLFAAEKHPLEVRGVKSVNMGDLKTSIKFENQSGKTVKLFWIDFEGNRKLYATIEAEKMVTQATFLGHAWLITDADDNAWYIFFGDGQARTVTIAAP